MNSFFSDLAEQFEMSFITNNRWLLYLKGLGSSLVITLGALALGVVLGIFVAVVRTNHDQRKGHASLGLKIINGICHVYTTVIRGTPMMVQLLIMGFVIFSSSTHYYMIAILSLGINSGAYVSEIIRGGIMSIDPGQMEAGRSLGMGYATVMKDIIIPQAIKNILPALGNELITLFKDTSLVSVIGMTELTKVARDIQARTYLPLMPYIGIAVMYLIVVMILTYLQGKLERRLRRSERK
ncbi:MAG: amino acid ABC transporter permease [Eubacterium sp.]|nr:amino acid ABC transporter permease [Eubacterium sp.]